MHTLLAVAWLAPNVRSVRHWDRLLGGALYAATPRVDWATLLRWTFSVEPTFVSDASREADTNGAWSCEGRRR